MIDEKMEIFEKFLSTGEFSENKVEKEKEILLSQLREIIEKSLNQSQAELVLDIAKNLARN